MVLAALLPSAAAAQSAPTEIIVTAPGGSFDQDDALQISAEDIRRAGHPDLLGALTRDLAGVSLSDAQNNPFQPNLVYRGFTASPLQGSAEGLAVYIDGGRFNQPFGDTVDFDLLPESAVASVTIKDASPVYGLNALGGAMVVATKTGRSAPGLTLEGSGGDHGRAEGSVEAGWNRGPWSAYLAAGEHHDGGWREHSPSALYNGYADLGYDGARAGLHLKLLAADSDLTGNGSAPVELLAADRRAVFTYPDNTRNRYARASLHPWAALSAHDRIEGSLYLQRLDQRTVNGDNSDVEPCGGGDDGGHADAPAASETGLLCLQDQTGADQPLLGVGGAQIAHVQPAFPYGVLNRTRTRTTAGGALVQLVDTRAFGAGRNRLTLGASLDASRTRFAASTELGELTADRDVVGLGPVIDQPDGVIAPVSVTAHTRYTGLFAADELPLAGRLSAELGLRYNIAHVSLDDRIGTALDGRHRFARLNPGIELDYTLSPALTLRAGYAETNRAPTPAELACAGADDPCSLTNVFVGDPALRQVWARSWEAGGSGGATVDGWRLGWLASLYRATNHHDIQYVASSVRGRAYFANIGRTRRQGAEATLDATRGPWTLRASYAFTDATFRTPLVLNSPDNPAADPDGTIAVSPGDRIPGVPRHRATLSADFDGRAFTLGGDIQAQSGQILFGDEANLQPKTRAFLLANLRGTIRLPGGLSLFGEVTNLFDRHDATFGTFGETDAVSLSEAPGASDPRSLGPGAPRRWLAGLRMTI